MSQAEELQRAIARIGELDVTRTLPGRLVWYDRWAVMCDTAAYPLVLDSGPYQGGLEAWPNGER